MLIFAFFSLNIQHDRNLPINTVEDNLVGNGFTRQNENRRITMIMIGKKQTEINGEWTSVLDILIPYKIDYNGYVSNNSKTGGSDTLFNFDLQNLYLTLQKQIKEQNG